VAGALAEGVHFFGGADAVGAHFVAAGAFVGGGAGVAGDVVDLVACFFFFVVGGGAEEFEDVLGVEFEAVEEGDEGEASHVGDVFAGLNHCEEVGHAGWEVLGVEFADGDGVLAVVSLLEDGFEALDVVVEGGGDGVVAGASFEFVVDACSECFLDDSGEVFVGEGDVACLEVAVDHFPFFVGGGCVSEVVFEVELGFGVGGVVDVEAKFFGDGCEEAGGFGEEVFVGVVGFAEGVASLEVGVLEADGDHAGEGVAEDFHDAVGFGGEAAFADVALLEGVVEAFDAGDACAFVEEVGEEVVDGGAVVFDVLSCLVEEGVAGQGRQLRWHVNGWYRSWCLNVCCEG